jgi:uncharacterized protein YkwD
MNAMEGLALRSLGRIRGRGLALAALLALVSGCTGNGPGSEEADRGAGQPLPAAAKSAASKPAAPKSAAARSPKQPAKPAARKPDLAVIERDVLVRVNRYRKSEGLPELRSDARIAEIARGHSREMAVGRTGFGHGGFKGRTQAVASRVPYKRVAENVSRHSRDPSKVPAVAVERWVASRGHRRNIEGPFVVTGVGAALGPDGSVYLTQVFVAPR